MTLSDMANVTQSPLKDAVKKNYFLSPPYLRLICSLSFKICIGVRLYVDDLAQPICSLAATAAHPNQPCYDWLVSQELWVSYWVIHRLSTRGADPGCCDGLRHLAPTRLNSTLDLLIFGILFCRFLFSFFSCHTVYTECSDKTNIWPKLEYFCM